MTACFPIYTLHIVYSVVRLFVYSVVRLFGCSFMRSKFFVYSCSFIRLFVFVYSVVRVSCLLRSGFDCSGWIVHNSTNQPAWVRAHHGEHTYGRPSQWNKWVPASRAGKVNRLAVREEWRTLHGIAHESGPNAKEKEMGSSARINDPVSTLTF